MARFGSPYAAGFGSPQNHLKRDTVRPASNGRPIQVLLEAAPGFGGAVFGVYVNDQKVREITPAEGVWTGPVNLPTLFANQSIQILREGHASGMDLANVARAEEGAAGGRAVLTWNWVSEFLGGSISPSWLSSWAFAGLVPGLLDAAGPLPREQASYTLTVLAGTATITISAQGNTVCQGSGAVGGSVTLVEANDSGFSGSVAVSGSAVDEAGILRFRWPAGAKIYRGSVLQVYFPRGAGPTARWAEPENLAAGSYSYTLAFLSDLGTLGAQGSPVVVAITAPPLPASNLHYDSGAAAALVVHWTASPTTGASYVLYVQGPAEGFMDLNKGVAVGVGVVTATLAAQSGYPGIVRVLLRAVKSGVEERQGQLIEIELDASGVRVAPRPNDLAIGTPTVLGETLSLPVVYSVQNEAASPAIAQLFVRVAGGSYNYASPAATVALGAVAGGYRVATLAYTSGVTGTVYAVVKAATAGGVQSENASNELTLEFDNSAPAGPTPEGQAARG